MFQNILNIFSLLLRTQISKGIDPDPGIRSTALVLGRSTFFKPQIYITSVRGFDKYFFFDSNQLFSFSSVIIYSVMYSDRNSFYGDVVSDSFNKTSRDEDKILEQIHQSK